METKMLDNLSTAIERVVKTLRGDAAPTKKRMPLGAFVNYAIAEIDKAARDEPAVAKRRLSALKRGVDDVLAGVAKLSAEDLASESVHVEVVTAFAPTRADGDVVMDEVTTAGDQSSTQLSLEGIAPATGDTAFAENLKAVGKALETLKVDLDEPPKPKPRASTKKTDGTGRAERSHGADRDAGDGGAAGSDREAGGNDGDGWPMDLNNAAFLKGDATAEAALTWGADPDGVASPKAR
jgi:hypothetical protein